MADGRPRFDPPYDELYDWLAANGVQEWLPERPRFVIDPAAGTLTYTAFRFAGPRGWNGEHIAVCKHEQHHEVRTVPLVAPPSAHLRALIAGTGARIEDPRRT